MDSTSHYPQQPAMKKHPWISPPIASKIRAMSPRSAIPVAVASRSPPAYRHRQNFHHIISPSSRLASVSRLSSASFTTAALSDDGRASIHIIDPHSRAISSSMATPGTPAPDWAMPKMETVLEPIEPHLQDLRQTSGGCGELPASNPIDVPRRVTATTCRLGHPHAILSRSIDSSHTATTEVAESVAGFSMSSHGSDYVSHLRPVDRLGSSVTTASSVKSSLALLPGLQRSCRYSGCQPHMAPLKEPTAALFTENVLPTPTPPSLISTLPADVTLMHNLRTADRRKKHQPVLRRGQLMHQRTQSTLSISSMTSIHGSNLPSWDDFDMLPRNENELTSFPKFESNSMRNSSLKRIGAKIMGEDSGTGLTGVGRFFSKVWTSKQVMGSRQNRRLNSISSWDSDADVSDPGDRIIDLDTIVQAGWKTQGKMKAMVVGGDGSGKEDVSNTSSVISAINIKSRDDSDNQSQSTIRITSLHKSGNSVQHGAAVTLLEEGNFDTAASLSGTPRCGRKGSSMRLESPLLGEGGSIIRMP